MEIGRDANNSTFDMDLKHSDVLPNGFNLGNHICCLCP